MTDPLSLLAAAAAAQRRKSAGLDLGRLARRLSLPAAGASLGAAYGLAAPPAAQATPSPPPAEVPPVPQPRPPATARDRLKAFVGDRLGRAAGRLAAGFHQTFGA